MGVALGDDVGLTLGAPPPPLAAVAVDRLWRISAAACAVEDDAGCSRQVPKSISRCGVLFCSMLAVFR